MLISSEQDLKQRAERIGKGAQILPVHSHGKGLLGAGKKKKRGEDLRGRFRSGCPDRKRNNN